MKPKTRKPRRYVAKDGTESWRVRYRDNQGTERSETFYDEDLADEFAGLVNTLGFARAVAYIDQRREDADTPGAVYTVDDLFDDWITFKSKRNKKGELVEVRSSRTIADYRRMYAARVKEPFGRKPANLVSPIEVQRWIDSLDMSPKTIADYHALLHGLYRWGISPTRALVVVDPCTETSLPKRRKKKAKGLRPAEWQILHAAARKVDDDAADALLLLASSGWRWSEAADVRVKDVDHWTDRDGISFTYLSMNRVWRREADHYATIEDAKSDAGERTIRLKGAAEQMVLRRIYGKGPNDLILTTNRGGRWHYTSFHQRYWTRPPEGAKDYAPKRKRILEWAVEMGLDRPDITLHWLRHTQAGMLILAGEPLPAIQRRLGHASIKTTVDTYGLMIEDASDAGLDRLAAMLDGEPLQVSGGAAHALEPPPAAD